MNVYVLCLDGEPVHSFVASDDHVAAVVARGMINKTAYGYKSDTEIIVANGLKPGDPPKLFNASIELYSVDLDGGRSDSICLVKDPLLDGKALSNLFISCLPIGDFDRVSDLLVALKEEK